MSSDVKKIRGQVRQVVQEILPDVLTAELVGAIEKGLSGIQKTSNEALNALVVERLDRIEKECLATMKRQDERARAVQGFLVQSAVNDLNNFVRNVHVTMLAWEELMGEKLGGVDKAEFDKQIDERKKTISAKLQKEHEEKMAANIAPPAEGNPNHPDQGPPNAEQPTPPAPEEPKEAEKATA